MSQTVSGVTEIRYNVTANQLLNSNSTKINLVSSNLGGFSSYGTFYDLLGYADAKTNGVIVHEYQFVISSVVLENRSSSNALCRIIATIAGNGGQTIWSTFTVPGNSTNGFSYGSTTWVINVNDSKTFDFTISTIGAPLNNLYLKEIKGSLVYRFDVTIPTQGEKISKAGILPAVLYFYCDHNVAPAQNSIILRNQFNAAPLSITYNSGVVISYQGFILDIIKKKITDGRGIEPKHISGTAGGSNIYVSV